MTEFLNALPGDSTLLSILFGAAVVMIVVEMLSGGAKRRRRRAYWKRRNQGRKTGKVVSLAKGDDPTVEKAGDQLKTVMQADFKPRALLNKPERRLLAFIDSMLAEESPGWRAMGQVSLGEILYSPDRAAFWAINAKRVDLLIVDANCRPLHAIEFQGTGHHKGRETAARDAVKKEALRRAGIGYVEVVSGQTPAEVRETLRSLFRRAA